MGGDGGQRCPECQARRRKRTIAGVGVDQVAIGAGKGNPDGGNDNDGAVACWHGKSLWHSTNGAESRTTKGEGDKRSQTGG